MTQPGSPPNDSSSRDDRGSTSERSSSDSTSSDARDDPYRRVRDDFDGLDLEHQATFLVDATVSLLAKGIEMAGRALADEVDGFVERQRKKAAKKAAKKEAAQTHADDTSEAGDSSSADVTAEDAESDRPERSDSTRRDSSTDDETNGGPDDLPPRGPLG